MSNLRLQRIIVIRNVIRTDLIDVAFDRGKNKKDKKIKGKIKKKIKKGE